jgi:hypothetical protein
MIVDVRLDLYRYDCSDSSVAIVDLVVVVSTTTQKSKPEEVCKLKTASQF